MWFKDRPRFLYIITLHLSEIANYFVILNNWAITPYPTTVKMNTTIVMETFDWRPPKLSFWNGKKIVEGRVWLVTAVKRRQTERKLGVAYSRTPNTILRISEGDQQPVSPCDWKLLWGWKYTKLASWRVCCYVGLNSQRLRLINREIKFDVTWSYVKGDLWICVLFI